MNPKEVLKAQFLEVVDNQLRDDDPPATRRTLERLKSAGYSEKEAKLVIAQCVADEIMAVMETNKPFNEERFVKCLEQLPGGTKNQ